MKTEVADGYKWVTSREKKVIHIVFEQIVPDINTDPDTGVVIDARKDKRFDVASVRLNFEVAKQMAEQILAQLKEYGV